MTPSSPGRLAAAATKVKKLNSVVALFEATIDKNAACGGTQSKLFLGNVATTTRSTRAVVSQDANQALSSSHHNPLTQTATVRSSAPRRASVCATTRRTDATDSTHETKHDNEVAPDVVLVSNDAVSTDCPVVASKPVAAAHRRASHHGAMMAATVTATSAPTTDLGSRSCHGLGRTHDVRSAHQSLDTSSHRGMRATVEETTTRVERPMVPPVQNPVSEEPVSPDHWAALRDQMMHAMVTAETAAQTDSDSDDSDESSVCSFECQGDGSVPPIATAKDSFDSSPCAMVMANESDHSEVEASEASLGDFDCPSPVKSPTRSPRRRVARAASGIKNTFHDSTDNMHADYFIADFEEQRRLAIRRHGPKRTSSKSLAHAASLADRMKAFQDH